MRRSKTIGILLGVLAVLCITAFAVSRIETHRENIRNSGEVFLSIDPESVTALSWEVGDSAFRLTKGDKWTYDDDTAFPVDQEKVNSLLEVFQEFGAAFVIDDAEDLSSYGLDAPEGTINITTAERTYTISLGDYSTMDAQRYVSIGDGKVYLVSHDPLEDYSLALSDLLQDDSIPAFDTVQSVSFAGDESYTLNRQEDGVSACADDVYFTGKKPLDTGAVEGYMSYVSSLLLDEYTTYNATDADLATYGLDEPELTATVNYTAGEEDGSFRFSLSRAPEDREKEDTSDVTAYIRMDDSPIIYCVSAYDYEALMAYTYNDLRHDDLVSAGFDNIYQMDVTLEGQTYTLQRDEDAEKKHDDGTAVWTYNGETVAIADLSSAVSSLSASEFTDNAKEGKQEISMKLYLHNDSVPSMDVSCYRYDGTSCVVQVDGETVALCERSQVVDLVEAVNSIVLTS